MRDLEAAEGGQVFCWPGASVGAYTQCSLIRYERVTLSNHSPREAAPVEQFASLQGALGDRKAGSNDEAAG